LKPGAVVEQAEFLPMADDLEEEEEEELTLNLTLLM
jgi:hypothetical protein